MPFNNKEDISLANTIFRVFLKLADLDSGFSMDFVWDTALWPPVFWWRLELKLVISHIIINDWLDFLDVTKLWKVTYTLFWYSMSNFVLRCILRSIYEPRHDKNQQSDCAPSEDSDQPGYPPIRFRVFAVRMKKAGVLSYPLSAQRRLWLDWADAQADLSLRWAHSHFVGFVMSRLNYYQSPLQELEQSIK